MAAENHIEMLGLNEGGVVVIDEHDEQLDFLLTVAAATPRKRFIKPLHQLWEHENRMLNAVLPESYIRPHKHTGLHSVDTVQALRGVFEVVIFNDEGEIAKSIPVAGRKIVSIFPDTWHTVVATSPCVIYQTTGHEEGGYDPKTHKVFPDWAPEEGTREAGSYLDVLKARVDAFFIGS